MPTQIAGRGKEGAPIERAFAQLSSPRLQMMLIVALTGAVGFFASVALWHAGVDALWLRYPLAVAIAYGAFLLFLWCWLRLRRRLLDALDVPSPGSSSSGSDALRVAGKPWEGGGGHFGGGGAGGSFAESHGAAHLSEAGSISPTPGTSAADVIGGAFDVEELALVLLILAALVGAAWVAISLVWAAPALLVEVLLDATLATGLYRRLRGVRGDHWLRTAIRRTGIPFLAIAVLFAVAGGLMQLYVPGARSIGEVIQWEAR